MTTMWLRRTLTGVTPLDDDLPRTWKVGDTLRAEITKPRDARKHRKAFILLKTVWPHTDYPTMEALRKAMTVGAGFVDEVINPLTGEVHWTPKSWAFNNMDALEFDELYSRLIDVALKIVPNSARSDWDIAVDEIARL